MPHQSKIQCTLYNNIIIKWSHKHQISPSSILSPLIQYRRCYYNHSSFMNSFISYFASFFVVVWTFLENHCKFWLGTLLDCYLINQSIIYYCNWDYQCLLLWHYFNIIISISKLSLKSLLLIQQSVKNSSKEEVSVSRDKEQEGVVVEPLYLISAG